MSDSDPQVAQRLRELGKRIRALRERSGLSQEDFADRCGLHRTYVGSVERGERNIGVKNLWAIADALDVSAAVLMEGPTRPT